MDHYAPGLENYWKVWDRVNGRVTEHLSPFQQKNLDALVSHPIDKAVKRVKGALPVIPVVLGSYMVLQWVKGKAHESVINDRP